MSGRRFFLWLQVVVSPVVCLLIVLRARFDLWDLAGLVAFGGVALTALIRLRREDA
jgi:hypothetical protein